MSLPKNTAVNKIYEQDVQMPKTSWCGEECLNYGKDCKIYPNHFKYYFAMSSRFIKGFFIIILLALGILGLFFFFYSLSTDRAKIDEDHLVIAATFYPLAEFSRHVGGDYVKVMTLTPPGMEPHDFEPSAKQITAMYEADLVVLNGGGIDAWATRLIPSLEKQGVRTLQMASFMDAFLPAVEEEEEEHEEETFDEHFWLSPVLTQKQVDAIATTLGEIDPIHRDAYRLNADIYKKELQQLHTEFQEGLASCKIKTVITSHAAFGYLAQAYGFTQLPIAGISPEQEPSASDLARLVDEAREKDIRYIFFETLVSPQLAQTLAEEVGAQTLVFNPLEGLTDEEISSGQDYFSIMRSNLTNLRLAMVCH